MNFIPMMSLQDQFDRFLKEKDLKPALKLCIKFSSLHSIPILSPLIDRIQDERLDEEKEPQLKVLKDIVYNLETGQNLQVNFEDESQEWSRITDLEDDSSTDE